MLYQTSCFIQRAWHLCGGNLPMVIVYQKHIPAQGQKFTNFGWDRRGVRCNAKEELRLCTETPPPPMP